MPDMYKAQNYTTKPQTSSFTCGPSALLMAMDSLNGVKGVNAIEEYVIWHEANTVFMGKGHPGTSAVGLAVSALRRGFYAYVVAYLGGDNYLFTENVKNGIELAAYKRVESGYDHTYGKLTGEHAMEELTRDPFPRLLKEHLSGNALIILLGEGKGDAEGHWVFIKSVSPDSAVYVDPYLARTQKGEVQVSRTELVQRMSFGAKGKMAFIVVSR